MQLSSSVTFDRSLESMQLEVAEVLSMLLVMEAIRPKLIGTANECIEIAVTSHG